ncbi:hypothetical protein C8_260 [Cannes 8 virus]|uniref:Uncharacterized protein n=1 Tax=Marseillevirus marseillevirus TaxID=694581 RepID=D2XAP9_GBMV|nr:hypothetical protein MAR_ORF251 [Marseillevirus marseillevirus]ADB04026.1 hypothetical protein MAR_ORF251 [Marseillevirus marseillevirus]AGV01609.1 hypothetical protein C8_260 [Cannes 8 virus]ANB78262.1 hypothetical protein MEL_223c [Melbournevirus]AVR52965.1 hypothetical protein MarSH_260 [Marseillevirus Shanghai 1]
MAAEIKKSVAEAFPFSEDAREISLQALDRQILSLENIIQKYETNPTRNRIIFAPLYGKNCVCRYRELEAWKLAVEERRLIFLN